MSRKQDRQDFTIDTRVTLLEVDEDNKDEVLASLQNDLRTMKNTLIGILISLATASILLAINLAINGLKP